MAKYLDLDGLTTFWTKIKSWVSSAVTTNSPSTSKTVTGWNEGKITYGNIQIAESQVTNLTTHLNAKAPLASPALTGTPTAPTASTGTDTTQIATTAFVNAEIASKMAESDAMVYKGTVAGGSTDAYGALTPAASKGWTYKVTTAGKIDGVAVEVGDMLICNTDSTAAATANNYSTIAENWDFIQGNTDGVVIGPASATSGRIATFDGTTGKRIKDSGYTIATSVPSGAVFTDTKVTAVGNHYAPAEDTNSAISASDGSATQLPTASSGSLVQVVTGLKRDAKGHVVGVESKGLWSPNNNTTYSNASLGQGYGTCATAEATAAKVVTLSNYALTTGGIVAVKFTYGLCASATMNINSKGAKNIFIHGAAATATTCKEVLAGDVVYFVYDGTQYQFLGTDRANKAPIVSITRSGTTFTATKMDGTTTTFTQQDSDTKNTAGSTNTAEKIFLVGATSQAANPQTYSHDTAYVGTDGCLYSGSKKVCTEETAAATYEPKMTAITTAEIEALT